MMYYSDDINMFVRFMAVLAIVRLSTGQQECPGNCSLCNEDGRCQQCKDGYYKSNDSCVKCSTNCKSDLCDGGFSSCMEGCKDGWHGTTCNDRCSDCSIGRCEVSVGHSYCANAVAKGNGLIATRDVVYWIIVGTIILLIGCLGFMMKNPPNPPKADVPKSSLQRAGIIPSNQQLLPGQRPGIFISSNRINTHLSFRDAYLDLDYVLNYPSDQSDDMESDIPPPSYDALFPNTLSSSGDYASSQ